MSMIVAFRNSRASRAENRNSSTSSNSESVSFHAAIVGSSWKAPPGRDQKYRLRTSGQSRRTRGLTPVGPRFMLNESSLSRGDAIRLWRPPVRTIATAGLFSCAPRSDDRVYEPRPALVIPRRWPPHFALAPGSTDQDAGRWPYAPVCDAFFTGPTGPDPR